MDWVGACSARASWPGRRRGRRMCPGDGRVVASGEIENACVISGMNERDSCVPIVILRGFVVSTSWVECW